MNKPHFSYTAVFVLVLLTLLTGCNANTTPEASVVDNTPVSDAVIDYTLAGKANPEAVNRGVAYLQLQEDLSPADVEATLQYLHEHDRAEMHDEMIAKLESGEVECWSLFEDYLIMGDSRTVGISYYGFLPTEKVWAEAGKHIRNAAAMKDEVVAEAPANLFMCYGMNDCVAGIWDSPEDWANEYAVLVEDLHRSLPSTKIFLCSILPASEEVEDALWSRIYYWNDALREMSERYDYCTYVDCDEVAKQHQELYESDGKHFVAEFYPYLGTVMVMALYDSSFEETPTPSESTEQEVSPTPAADTDNQSLGGEA